MTWRYLPLSFFRLQRGRSWVLARRARERVATSQGTSSALFVRRHIQSCCLLDGACDGVMHRMVSLALSATLCRAPPTLKYEFQLCECDCVCLFIYFDGSGGIACCWCGECIQTRSDVGQGARWIVWCLHTFECAYQGLITSANDVSASVDEMAGVAIKAISQQLCEIVRVCVCLLVFSSLSRNIGRS